MAYRNNPNIEAQRAFLRATDEGVAQALSGWRPRVQIDATGGRALRERNFSRDFDVEDDNGNGDTRYSAGFTVTQPLYSGRRTVADTERAEGTVQIGRAPGRDKGVQNG